MRKKPRTHGERDLDGYGWRRTRRGEYESKGEKKEKKEEREERRKQESKTKRKVWLLLSRATINMEDDNFTQIRRQIMIQYKSTGKSKHTTP